MKVGVAGSVESNDILITVVESNELVIEITSIVDAFFNDQIEKVIKDTLEQLNIKNVKVTCQDKGALDYTIKARLVTALTRMEESNA
jgi:citrate lyase subunit gamma (acyl carrier protein)